MPKRLSYPKEKIRIVLFEKVDDAAAAVFAEAGYRVELHPAALQGDRLIEAIRDAHIIGVRSRTKIFAPILSEARRLLAVGCFSVGTDQVDLPQAAAIGVPVFNAPHSSTRSVAELTIACVLALARRMPEVSAKLHQGIWEKSAVGAYEVRGKTLGIVGYGHIGGQVSLLAEALGLEVCYYDVRPRLALGRAKALSTLDELLAVSDFLTLHVPGGNETAGLIGEEQLAKMKHRSYLLNLSRGGVVDVEALGGALDTGRLAGAALDVFPTEPAKNSDRYDTAVSGKDNVILTPHIGGSTEEAQRNIAAEVARALIEFLDTGTSTGSVNFPQIQLPAHPGSHRILNVHKNVPGALGSINQAIASLGVNVDSQYLGTDAEIGYLITDLNQQVSEKVQSKIGALAVNIKTRILY